MRYFFVLFLEGLEEDLGGLVVTGRLVGVLLLFFEEELGVVCFVAWLAFSPPLTGRRPSPLRK